MSDEKEPQSTPSPSISTKEPVPSKIPNFDTSSPHIWFKYLESYFYFHNITSQTTMFWYVVSELPSHVTKEVYDIIEPIPAESPYDVLKSAILKRTTPSEDARLQQLLCETELGDRTPSQLLRHMRTLADRNHINDCILRKLWSKRLPAEVNAILAVHPDNMPLELLAEIADKVHEALSKKHVNSIVPDLKTEVSQDNTYLLQQQISQMNLTMNQIAKRVFKPSTYRHRSPSKRRSTSVTKQPSVCYYHRKFGDNARKCTLPCAHPNAFYRRTPEKPGNLPASQ